MADFRNGMLSIRLFKVDDCNQNRPLRLTLSLSLHRVQFSAIVLSALYLLALPL